MRILLKLLHMRSRHGRTGVLGAQESFKGKEDSTGEIK